MKPTKNISVFFLAMMNVAVILSLRGLPLMAKEGLSLIFYLTFSLFIFLIPTALVSAELATGWPEEGGIFRWVSEAFGERAGFTAIWLQWVQNIFWYPTILSFAAGALAYLFLSPELAQNPFYNMGIILLIYWGSTCISLGGLRASGWFSSMGVLFGTILPAIFIISLGLIWWGEGNVSLLSAQSRWLPDFSRFSNLSLLGGIVLLFAGMEVNAVHANEVDNPTKSYPKAIFLSVLLIFLIFLLGSLSIAAVLSPAHISLTSGLMQAFTKFLEIYHLDWIVPIMGLFISLGAIGGVAAWIVGPSKGILMTAKSGLIPHFLSFTNKAGVPSHILYIQGVIVTILSQLYLIMPTINSAFFLLSDLTVILYLIMYLFMFTAAIYLRYKEPNRPRPYKIPFGNLGMWIISLIGILGALFAIFIGFFPPSQLKIVNPRFYVSFLAVGITLALGIPQIIVSMKKPKWKADE